MKKKLTCMLLAFVMLLAMFSGCAKKEAAPAAEETSPVKESASVETADDAEAPEEEAAVEEAPEVETEALVDAPPDNSAIYPLNTGTDTLTYWQAWPPFLATYCEPQDSGAFVALQEATGVALDVTWVDTETSGEKFNLLVVSGEYPDMLQGAASKYTGGGTKAIEDEVLIDIWPYVYDYMPNFAYAIGDNEEIRRSLLDDAGQMSAVPGLYNEYYYTDQGMWIRQDFLDKVGLSMPNTLAEMETVLEAFLTELNLTDPYVMLATGECRMLQSVFETGSKAVDGKIVDNSLGDNMKDYYKKVHEWWEKGYIKKDFLSNDYSETKPPQELVYQDLGGMFVEDVASISTYVKNSTNPDFKLVAMPQILKDENQVLTTGTIPQLVADKYTLSVSTCCTDIETTLRVIDYMFSDEGMILGNYGIKDETYYIEEDGSYKFTDFVLNHALGMQGAQSAFINPGFPCLNDLSVNQLTYNDEQKEAVDVWMSNFTSSEHTVPSYNLTTEENSLIATIQTDIQTYQEEMMLKFIMGEVDIDAAWDEYVENIISMGYETVAEINQTAYERYLAK